MIRAFVGLGANLGDARESVEAAMLSISGLPGTHLAVRSALYKTSPVDADGPDFINAVAALDTSLAAPTLLAALQAIERDHGRERPYRNAPRTLDLDLLTYGDAVMDTPDLTLPHPRMAARAFVLVPLIEIAPDLELPGLGRVRDLLSAVAGQCIERIS